MEGAARHGAVDSSAGDGFGADGVAVTLEDDPLRSDAADPMDDETPGVGLAQHDVPALQVVRPDRMQPDAGSAPEEGEHTPSTSIAANIAFSDFTKYFLGSVGGIVGLLSNASVEGSSAYVALEIGGGLNNYSGGIAGQVYFSDVTNCAAGGSHKNSKYITDKGILKKIFTFIMSVFYNSKFYIVPLILLLLSGFIYFKNKDKVNIEFKTFKKGAIFWILGFALILRLSDLSSFYWTDELYSVYEAGNVNFPFLKTFSDPGNPPLFFILARIYMLLFGVEPNVTRMLSVIFSVICIYAVYIFVKNNLNEDNKNKIALIVSFLYSINIYSICIAQEFRCYSLCALFSVLCAYLLFEIIKYKKNKDFVLYTFLSILMANTHYFQILILISNFIIAMIFLDNKSRIKFFISNFIAFLSFLPYFFMTALNNALLNEEFNKFLMPDINFYIDTFIKFIQGKTAFIIVMVLFFISLVPYLRKKIFEKDDKFLNLFWYSMYTILSLFVLSYLFSLVKPIAKMYYFTVILPFFVILFVLSCFILKKKSIAFLISFFMVCSLFSYSDYIQRDKSRLLDFKRIVKFYYCDSKYHNQKSALIVPHSKEMIKNAFPYYLDDDEIIVIKPPLSVEKLTEKIEKSKAENFYIKIEYNIFKNFFDIMPENYDYEIIRTDKDVIIARIMKRGASL